MELLAPVKEAVSESARLELRSSDLATPDPLKTISAFDEAPSEKSAEIGAEGLALVSPQSLGVIFSN